LAFFILQETGDINDYVKEIMEDIEEDIEEVRRKETFSTQIWSAI
jgi:hypothetical protein